MRDSRGWVRHVPVDFGTGQDDWSHGTVADADLRTLSILTSRVLRPGAPLTASVHLPTGAATVHGVIAALRRDQAAGPEPHLVVVKLSAIDPDYAAHLAQAAPAEDALPLERDAPRLEDTSMAGLLEEPFASPPACRATERPPRHVHRLPVQLGDGPSRPWLGRTIDVSRHGCGLTTRARLRRGMPLTLAVKTSAGLAHLSGSVVWVRSLWEPEEQTAAGFHVLLADDPWLAYIAALGRDDAAARARTRPDAGGRALLP
jgi:hypothetical protein